MQSKFCRASEKQALLRYYSPLDTICLDRFSDNIQTTGVCAVSSGLQTRLGQIERVSDEDGADTTEATGEERLDRGGGLLLLLELLILDDGRSLIVGHFLMEEAT